jgi:hypothetical protein
MRRLLCCVALLVAANAYAWPRAAGKPPASSNILNVGFSEYSNTPQVEPGGQHHFEIVEFTASLWPFWPQPAFGIDISWTIEPADWGATIDRSGVVSVADWVGSGVTYRVYANLNHGQRIISTPLYVYKRGNNPFADAGWTERAWIPCDGSADIPVPESQRIQEFSFRIDGLYLVTWHPFEAYVDYWGPYRFDPSKHKITFAVDYGNYVPDDLHGEGTYEITNNGPPVTNQWGYRYQPLVMRLKGIWLGSADRTTPPAPAPCGMVFDGAMSLN